MYGRSNNLYLLSESGKIMGMLVKDTKLDAQQAGKQYKVPAPPCKPDASLVSFQEVHNLLIPFIGQEAQKALRSALFGLSPQQTAYICKMAGLSENEPVSQSNINITYSIPKASTYFQSIRTKNEDCNRNFTCMLEKQPYDRIPQTTALAIYLTKPRGVDTIRMDHLFIIRNKKNED